LTTDSIKRKLTAHPARIILFMLFAILGCMMEVAQIDAAEYSQYTRKWTPKTAAQREVMACTARDLLNDGPWGTGKTNVAAAKAYMMGTGGMDEHGNWIGGYPGNVIALVRKKRVDLKATLWKVFIDNFIDPLPDGYVVKSNDTDLYRKMRNGTEYWGVGLDSTLDVNKLASREYGFIAVEEASEITEDDYDVKIGRCMRLPTVPFHQVLSITNPSHPSHFLNQRFMLEQWEGYQRIQGTLLPDLPESYHARLDQLTGVRRQRYKDGLWVAQEGAVYPYDPAKHLINMADLERYEGWQNWERVIGIDFGFDHPYVALFFAVSPSDVWYMYKEIYMTGRSPTQKAKQLRAEIDGEGIADNVMIYCDHDSEVVATFEEYGLEMNKAKKERLAGQGSVYDLFEEGRIFFVRNALVETDQGQILKGLPIQTVDEFPYYVWKEGGKEDMVKVKDDGMDAMRYAVHSHRWCY